MKNIYIIIISLIAFAFSSCDDFIDRNPLDSFVDNEEYWTNEQKVRLYANQMYGHFFAGYGSGFNSNYAAYLGYLFSDDIVQNGTQTNFELSVPSARGTTSSSSTENVWLTNYTGPTWNFAFIRTTNIMLERLNTHLKGKLSDEAFNHWVGVGRFFRGVEYAGLATVFGDVPYYDHVVSDIDYDDLFKDRTPRDTVMDAVYDDLVFALENVRINDGDQYVNKYVVAGFISRLALIEGTWQKYHHNNTDRAKKFLELAVKAADLVRNSGKYAIHGDYRSLFASESLSANRECIMYRVYDQGKKVTHTVLSYSTLAESRNYGVTRSMIESFICNDGNPWQNSSLENADDFSLSELVKTRDPRFEASFWCEPSIMAKGSLLYIVKYAPRGIPELVASGGALSSEYTGSLNTTDAPVMRYAEVLLNWIEAKAELATMGSAAVTQGDIDASINAIRDRPLAKEAEAKGVKKTAKLDIQNITEDPQRDPTVTPLLWEIRRERRMELSFEHSRILDLRRWKKLEYMDTDANPELLQGTWVNLQKEMPGELVAANANIVAVVDLKGNKTVYNGGNADKMIGFYTRTTHKPRQPFLNLSSSNPYLAPVGKDQIDFYKSKGYVLTQTKGWAGN